MKRYANPPTVLHPWHRGGAGRKNWPADGLCRAIHSLLSGEASRLQPVVI